MRGSRLLLLTPEPLTMSSPSRPTPPRLSTTMLLLLLLLPLAPRSFPRFSLSFTPRLPAPDSRVPFARQRIRTKRGERRKQSRKERRDMKGLQVDGQWQRQERERQRGKCRKAEMNGSSGHLLRRRRQPASFSCFCRSSLRQRISATVMGVCVRMSLLLLLPSLDLASSLSCSGICRHM